MNQSNQLTELWLLSGLKKKKPRKTKKTESETGV